MRQNNLKGFDLDLPLGAYIAVTGLSGSGKSSLVFDTLHAEGQRRYVETFSAYTRQFLELLDQPKVDRIENIRPSIAIEQTNTVKNSRSTVGTMTELTDYFKVWFSHAAECFDPETGEKVEDDNPHTIWTKALAAVPGQTTVIAFRVDKPGNLSWSEILANLRGQAYLRLLVPVQGESWRGARIDEAQALLDTANATQVFVAQDRLPVTREHEARFLEAAETALHFGKGQVHLFVPASERGDAFTKVGSFSRGLHSPSTDRRFRPPSPGLFSFNSPIGACPRCRGFGRVIDIDYRLAMPNTGLSLDQGAVKCWEGEVYRECLDDLRKFARRRGLRMDVPFDDLPADDRAFVIDGEPGYGEENGKTWPQFWYGLKGFFRWLEKNSYKMHVRVFLSRYRSYNLCPDCRGARLQPEALCWRWQGRTLPDLYSLPVDALLGQLRTHASPGRQEPGRASADAGRIALDAILTRLRYLDQVGLGYLSLDRPSKTLSGGEVERVNLTSCLGTSLVDTLFVLDEPSVGLHPRDIDRLIGIIRSLTRAGNTVVVVEHDESMIRAADHVVELGPEPGAKGGHLMFQGPVPRLLADRHSLTGAYLSGRMRIDAPTRRRPVELPATPSADHPLLRIRGASKHNLRALSLDIPLRRLVCLSGVSGSGKSTLLSHVIHQGMQVVRREYAEDPATFESITADLPLAEVILVDQSPLSRTPRSNPALYTESWELIRELYAATPEAQAAGFTASSFSFNSGDGRCDHCQGLGYERVEMQFLSDVFVPCPVCSGRRFKDEVLAIRWNQHSVSDLLALSVDDALGLFATHGEISTRLAPLAEVGLGYLRLGQPLNTLSGGEAQRLKLVKYLAGIQGGHGTAGSLILLDEPTTGLHRHDVKQLISVLQRLVDVGHSLIVIEHNTDVLKSADWLIEIGPEAGDRGGLVVGQGAPELLASGNTATAPYLRSALGSSPGEYPTHSDLGAEFVEESPSAAPNAIRLTGARENNLKNLSLSIPHGQLSVVTGVSGSGKSTLAFDIVFSEGQRRFMESMSPYARQFVEQMSRPDIDALHGIPPTVAIEQRVTRGSRKSTVATITEVAQYLRLLYARLGVQHHPESGRPVVPLSPAGLKRLLSRTLETPAARRAGHLYLCSPIIRGRKGHHQPIATWIQRQGYQLMRVDGRLQAVDAFTKLDRYKEHDIEAVVADLSRLEAGRTPGSALDDALKLGKGACFVALPNGRILSWFSTTRTDAETGESFPELDPKHFSHNSPKGWCPTCRGHGRIFPWMLDEKDEKDEDSEAFFRTFGIESGEELGDMGRLCPDCHGTRLNRVSRAVRLPLRTRPGSISLPELLALPAGPALDRLRQLELDERGRLVARDIVAQIEERLRFLEHVGLGYLALERSTATLSGGEAQRIRLASQLGSNLSGVLYVLDEPSIGLHARDNERLIETLVSLRERGNTLLVVEHDDELMLRADHLIDLGPGAGVHGGEILAQGTPEEVKSSPSSLTGLFLAKGIAHPWRGAYRSVGDKDKGLDWLEFTGVRFRNLDHVDLRLPLGRLIMVAGPSGAGKSTLFRDLLHPAVAHAIRARKGSLSGRTFARQSGFGSEGGEAAAPVFDRLTGADAFKSVIEVDQSPIGKTPRSTPATYLGIFDRIREFFASLPESRIRGYTASRFSFNTAGGRCPTCEGAGRVKLEMAFMPDAYLPCDDCKGLRYGAELDDLAWNGRTIGQVLQLTFSEAAEFLSFDTHLRDTCRLMVDCGLGYLTLGQSSPTLSGGEAQRLKLVTELAKGLQTYTERSRGLRPRQLYLLEEPTIGLHLSDCERLIRLLHGLVDQGHTVVVIEHHLDLLAEADWIVELGPGGGPEGGKLLYQGPLKGLLTKKRSPTAPYLAAKLRY
ncbi:UvrABC system protein A [mine drainage metagenome]|uniref:UvrABC system protein A n=1 Tax=mine drainage metagenome TaxID=410659 RepID=A0A1J5SFR3_9ZZZZ